MLAGWHGWGSFPRVFDDRVDHTAGERAARAAIARAEQRWPGYLATARRTVLNAHYTDPAIVAAGWRFLRSVGADPQRHVGWEPGAGTGLWMSDSLSVPMHGVELDAVSAAVGNHLVPAGSEVVHGSLVDATVPTSGPARDGYDLVAGNVPFASFAPHADDNPHGLSLHNYALVKAASMVRPGGYLVVVTSRYTLDAADSTTRRLLAELTNMVGAVRLPTGAHAVRAGTEVVSDVLVMHRPDDGGELHGWPEPATVMVEGTEVFVSSHFVEHPEMVLGEWALGGMRHADDIRVIHDGARDGGYLAALTDRLASIATVAPRLEVTGRAPAAEVAANRPPADLPVGSIVPLGHSRYERWTSQGQAPHAVPRTQQTELEWLCQLRDATRALLRADAAGSPAVDERRRLNELYDRYVARFGPLNRFRLAEQKSTSAELDSDGSEPAPRRLLPRMGGFRSDPGWWPVAALEVFDDESQTARKAPIMSRPVAATAEYPYRVDDPATAVSVLLARDGQLSSASVAELAGIADDQVGEWLGDLAFRDPERDGALTPAAVYLSGLVRRKLNAATRAAESDPAYQRNVTALDAVLPMWLGPHEISARLGAPWIPATDVEAFVVEELKLSNVDVVHVAETASWTLTSYGFSAENAYTYAVEGKRTALELVEDLANQRATRITVEDADGRRVLDVEATSAATAKRGELEDLFAGWVWSDPDRADRLAAVYNDRFNAYVEPRWDGSALQLDGLSAEFTPRPHQLDAVARILGDRDRGTLLAHPVGAGKTAVMAISAIELRRLGISAGPVGIVVPNSMLQQFAREFLQLYPQANILVADDANFGRDQRREFVARAASGTYDVVLFTHSSFTAVAPSPDTIVESTQREIDAHRSALEAVVEMDGGQASRKAVKQIETAIAQLEQRLAKATDRAHHDTGGVEFEQLGLGHLMVDEAHLAKNLSFPTRIDGVSPRESARARDLLVKADWMREHRGAGSVTFATATPVTNQLSELWVFQRFLDPDGLARAGVEHFDAWAANFAQSVTAVEIAPSGSGFRTVARFARFTNVPELSRFFRAFGDVRSADELGLPRPTVAGGQAEVVAIAADDELREFMAALVERAGKVKRGRRLEKGDDTVLAVAGDGRVGALDMRLASQTVGYGPIDGPSAKIAAAADRIAQIHHANVDNIYTGPDGHPLLEPGATQIVFCDHGVPGNPRRDVYSDLAEALVERGIPRGRVAFVQSANTHELRARLFAGVREGRVSVLVGSTESMGVGVNVQTRLVASHILTPPWRPDQVEQAEGRILRQGNQNREVQLLRYAREGSYDAYTWQTIERKSRFIAQIMTAPDQLARQVVDNDAVADEYAALKAIAAGDPRLVRQAQLEARVTSLERARSVHQRTMGRLRGHLDQSIAGVARLADMLRAVDAMLTTYRAGADPLLHHRDGSAQTLQHGETGNGERIGRHVLAEALSLVRTYRPGEMDVMTVAGVTWRLEHASGVVRLYPATATVDDLMRVWRSDELARLTPAGVGQSLGHLVRDVPTVRERVEHSLRATQRRVSELRARANDPFPQGDELTAAQLELNTLRDELTTSTEPSAAATTPVLVKDRGGIEI